MMVAFIPVAIVFILGGVAIHAENGGNKSPIPDWVTVTTIISLIGWMFYRALIARPRCPACKSKDTKQQGDYHEKQEDSKNPEIWRCYHCSPCDVKLLVPGLSLHG